MALDKGAVQSGTGLDKGAVQSATAAEEEVTGSSGDGGIRTRYHFLFPRPDEDDAEFWQRLQLTVGQSRSAFQRRAEFARFALSVINKGK